MKQLLCLLCLMLLLAGCAGGQEGKEEPEEAPKVSAAQEQTPAPPASTEDLTGEVAAWLAANYGEYRVLTLMVYYGQEGEGSQVAVELAGVGEALASRIEGELAAAFPSVQRVTVALGEAEPEPEAERVVVSGEIGEDGVPVERVPLQESGTVMVAEGQPPYAQATAENIKGWLEREFDGYPLKSLEVGESLIVVEVEGADRGALTEMEMSLLRTFRPVVSFEIRSGEECVGLEVAVCYENPPESEPITEEMVLAWMAAHFAEYPVISLEIWADGMRLEIEGADLEAIDQVMGRFAQDFKYDKEYTVVSGGEGLTAAVPLFC